METVTLFCNERRTIFGRFVFVAGYAFEEYWRMNLNATKGVRQ